MGKKSAIDEAAVEALVQIKGVGVSTAEKLLETFGTINAILAADDDALAEAGARNAAIKGIRSASKKREAQKAKAKKTDLKVVDPVLPPKPVVTDPTPPPKPVAPAAPKPAMPPIPIPFGGKDVTVRTTPAPEIIAIRHANGDIERLDPPRSIDAEKPAPPVKPVEKVVAKPVAKVAPKPVVKPAAPVAKAPATPQKRLSREFLCATTMKKVQLDVSDKKVVHGKTLYRVYSSGNAVGYGEVVRGKVHVRQ